MITFADGNKYRTSPLDPTELEGFILQPDGKTFVQQYLPCKYRQLKVCATCKKTKQSKLRNACTLKRINQYLVCVGCLERKQAP